MQRMKQANHSTSGITNVSRNAPPPPVPAVAALAPDVAQPVEEAKPPVKRSWNRAKRDDGNKEKSAPDYDSKKTPVNPTKKPLTKKKGDTEAAVPVGTNKKRAAVPSAAEDPEKDTKKAKFNARTTQKKGRGAGKKAAATKKAAAVTTGTFVKQKKAKAATFVEDEVDPIEDTSLPDVTDGIQVQSSPGTISDEDRPYLEGAALPEWMNKPAQEKPAPSPVFKSQYAVASPQQRASSFDESSDDDDDEFAMNKAFINAAADEKAAVGIAAAKKDAAKPPKARGNKKLAAVENAATDPYQLNIEKHPTKDVKKKSKLVSTAQKPRAVATKRQSAATKKKPAAVAAATAGKKKKPAAKKPTAATAIHDIHAGGRKQPRRAAASQAAAKTKKQLNSQSINLKDDSSSDVDDIVLKTMNGVYGADGNLLYHEDGSDDGWGAPLTQVPPSRMLLEDTNTTSDEDVGDDGADRENGGHHGADDVYNYDDEYAVISKSIPPSAARHGGKSGLVGLKASLAGNTTTTAAGKDGTGAMAAADVLRKRVTPPSNNVKKGKGRISNMLPVGGAGGPATGDNNSSDGVGRGGRGVKKRKAQPVGQTPAKLQTETPAADAGKKRDAVSSDEPKIKTVSKAAKAALVAGAAAAQKQRGNAGTKKKAAAVIQLESNTTSEDEEQINAYEFTVAEKQQKRAPGPAPVTASTKKRSAAAAMFDDVDMEELLEEEEEEVVNVKPVLTAATRTALGLKNINSSHQAVKKEVNFDNDLFLNEPDEDFEIVLDSDSEDENKQQALVAVGPNGGGGRGARGGRKKKNAAAATAGGGANGDTAAFLQLLQGRLGGADANLDSEDDDDNDDDDDDDDDAADFGSSGFVHVQAAIAQAVASRNRKAQRARTAQVKKLEKETKTELSNVQNDVQASVSAAEAKAAEDLAVVEGKLMENEEEIQVIQAEYDVKMTELSEKQRVLATEAERVGQEATRHVAEAKNRGKRRLHEAFTAVKGKLEEGKRRIQRAAKKAKRMPDLASLLVPLFASG